MNKNKVIAGIAILLAALGVVGYLYKDIIADFLGVGQSAMNKEIVEAPQAPQEAIPPTPAPPPEPPKPNHKAECDKGSAEACFIFADEQLSQNNHINALNALLAPCLNKNASACDRIASIYTTQAPTPTLAVAYSTISCEYGSLDGCYALGVRYYRGDGMNRDVKQSFNLFKKVCDGGKVEGCNNLAVIYNNADGVKRNVKFARSLFKKACDSGYAPSCDNLAKIK